MKGNFHVRFGERGGETRRPQGRKVRPAPTLRSGNFLYVTLEHLKRLEGEVLESLRSSAAGADAAGARRPDRRPAPVPRPRDQPARRRHRRAGAVDRLPAMALPHPRQRGRRPSRSCATSTTSSAATPCSPGTRSSRCWTPPASPSPAGTAARPSRTRSPASRCPTRPPACPR